MVGLDVADCSVWLDDLGCGDRWHNSIWVSMSVMGLVAEFDSLLCWMTQCRRCGVAMVCNALVSYSECERRTCGLRRHVVCVVTAADAGVWDRVW